MHIYTYTPVSMLVTNSYLAILLGHPTCLHVNVMITNNEICNFRTQNKKSEFGGFRKLFGVKYYCGLLTHMLLEIDIEKFKKLLTN